MLVYIFLQKQYGSLVFASIETLLVNSTLVMLALDCQDWTVLILRAWSCMVVTEVCDVRIYLTPATVVLPSCVIHLHGQYVARIYWQVRPLVF